MRFILRAAIAAAVVVAAIGTAGNRSADAQMSTKPGGVIHGTQMLETPEPMPAKYKKYADTPAPAAAHRRARGRETPKPRPVPRTTPRS